MTMGPEGLQYGISGRFLRVGGRPALETAGCRAGRSPWKASSTATVVGVNEVESRTGAVTVVSRWLFDLAFASSPQSGLAWLCFLFPLIEPDRRSYRIRLSEKTHADSACNAVCNF